MVLNGKLDLFSGSRKKSGKSLKAVRAISISASNVQYVSIEATDTKYF